MWQSCLSLGSKCHCRRLIPTENFEEASSVQHIFGSCNVINVKARHTGQSVSSKHRPAHTSGFTRMQTSPMLPSYGIKLARHQNIKLSPCSYPKTCCRESKTALRVQCHSVVQVYRNGRSPGRQECQNGTNVCDLRDPLYRRMISYFSL